MIDSVNASSRAQSNHFTNQTSTNFHRTRPGEPSEDVRRRPLTFTLCIRLTSDLAKRVGRKYPTAPIHIALRRAHAADVEGTPFIDMTLDEFEQPIRGYATTQFLTATAAAKRMDKQGSGVILMVTPPLGHVPSASAGAFGIACSLIEALARNLVAEVGPRGVRVICLRTSGSPESRSVQESLDRLAKAEGKSRDVMRSKFEQTAALRRMTSLNELANVAILMASDLASSITATAVNSTCGDAAD